MLREYNKEPASSRPSLSAPPFPFPPYQQQSELMAALIECMESSAVGVFESPTGTGKSLSVICSAMHWLRAEEQSVLNKAKAEVVSMASSSSSSSGSKDVDWLLDIIQKPSEKEKKRETELKSKALDRYQNLLDRIEQAKTRKRFAEYSREYKRPSSGAGVVGGVDAQGDEKDEDSEFVLEEYLSDDERKARATADRASGCDEGEDDDEDEDEDEDDLNGTRRLKMPQVSSPADNIFRLLTPLRILTHFLQADLIL
jgi:chromosome transmission fidelity protein 1